MFSLLLTTLAKNFPMFRLSELCRVLLFGNNIGVRKIALKQITGQSVYPHTKQIILSYRNTQLPNFIYFTVPWLCRCWKKWWKIIHWENSNVVVIIMLWNWQKELSNIICNVGILFKYNMFQFKSEFGRFGYFLDCLRRMETI